MINDSQEFSIILRKAIGSHSTAFCNTVKISQSLKLSQDRIPPK